MATKRKQKAGNIEEIAAQRFVLVGTYKGDQLTDWRGWYNYPVSDEDKITDAEAAKITELWLFKGTRDERRYKAEFVGVKTREELVRDYGYPAKGKAHGDKYLLFKTEFKYQHKGDVSEDAERVIIRTADFATAPNVRKQLKAYLESPDRNDPDLAKRLPTIITKLRPEQLCVCEAAVQYRFQEWTPVVRSAPLLDKIESIVMSIGEFGRTHALSSSDAYVYLKKYKGLEYLDKYHVSLSCFPIESLVDDLSKVCRNNGGTLR